MSETVTVTGNARPMQVFVGGRQLVEYTQAEAGRDLADIAGGFRVSYFPRHVMSAFGDASPIPVSKAGVAEAMRISEHDPVEVRIYGETVLKGWVDDIQLQMDGSGFQAAISGRDVTGDLVDASANPIGPGEYRQVTLADLVASLCNPFGITVATDANIGAPFTLVALEPAETVMAAIERHSRQRGILVTSDGVGGVILTQAGRTRAPDSLRNPGNVLGLDVRKSSRARFSDVWVHGAFGSLLRPAQSPLRSGSAPLQGPLSASAGQLTPSQIEAQATLRYGHAIDPEVRRHRPRAFLSSTQSGGSVAAQQAANPVDPNGTGGNVAAGAYRGVRTPPRRKAMKPRTDATPWTLQDQAEWRMRSTRAGATMHVYTVAGLHAHGALWLPNALVAVQDRYADLDQDMLIGAVTWVDGPEGYQSRISVVQPDAYDLTGDVDTRHNGVRHTRSGRAVDGSAK